MNKTACIIVNYNDSNRTLNLVKAIDEYTSIDWIIVIDNCSPDGSYSNLKSFESKKYYLLKAVKNGGYGYGNNLGAKKAKELSADSILIANPDVCFTDECICHMKDTLAHNPSCAIVGAKEIKVGSWAWRYTSTLDDVLSASLFFNKVQKRRYYSKEFFEGKKYAEVDIIPGCLLLVDLSKFIEIGGYDEAVFLYEEEKILYCRLGGKYKSIVDLNVEYEHNHEESHSYTLKSMLKGKKRLLDSRVYFLKKYRKLGWPEMFLAKSFFLLTMFEMTFWWVLRRFFNR